MKFYNNGKLIVVEGGDGSGKNTQARLLTKALQEYGPANFFEFPRYKKSAFGDLIGRCLAGEFGDFVKLSPYLASLPYILDRARAKYLLLESLKEGNVVCDRYTTSNMAYQAAKLSNGKRAEFVKFLENGEYGELGLPVPDLVIYLQVPVKTAGDLVNKKSQRSYLSKKVKKDQHEEDLDYQQKVSNMYLRLAKEQPNWQVIKCMEKDRFLSREEIHLKVMRVVKPILKIA